MNFPNDWEFGMVFVYLYSILKVLIELMTELPYTVDNIALIQKFINKTRKRISEGVDITFTGKASFELEDLVLEFDIDATDIESAVLGLTTDNYYRGIDPSGRADFNVCAFCTTVGNDNVEIYLKYGLEVDGLQILLFSNHAPKYPMSQPFKK